MAARALKRPFLVALLGGLAVNLAMGSVLGARLGTDTAVHLLDARFLLDHGTFNPSHVPHPGYAVFLALCLKVFGTPRATVFLQVPFSILALALLFAEWHEWARPQGLWIDLAAVAAIALNPFVLFWNWYVLSESIYVSLLVCVFISMLRWVRTSRVSWLYAGSLLTILAWLTRTNGIALLVAVTAAVALWAVRHRRLSRLTATGLLAASVICVVGAHQVFQPTYASSQVRAGAFLADGVVIWGYDAGNLRMPAYQLHEGGWLDYVGFARAHPLSALKVWTSRVLVEAIRYRPYWSWRQNLVSVSMMVVAWALVGVAVARDPNWLVTFGLTLVGYHLAVVALVLSDWDGRLLGHVLPIVMTIACLGLARLAER
jgi:hypothetical protein